MNIDTEILKRRIAKAKNDMLMEEPCPMYEEADEDDWYDFWHNEDTVDDNLEQTD